MAPVPSQKCPDSGDNEMGTLHIHKCISRHLSSMCGWLYPRVHLLQSWANEANPGPSPPPPTTHMCTHTLGEERRKEGDKEQKTQPLNPERPRQQRGEKSYLFNCLVGKAADNGSSDSPARPAAARRRTAEAASKSGRPWGCTCEGQPGGRAC